MLNSQVDAVAAEGEQHTRLSRRKLAQVLLRAMIGGTLIAFLAWRSDLGTVLRSLGDASFGYVLAAYLLVLAALILGAFRWRPYLHQLGFETPVGTTIRLSLIGAFFNAFLPTGIGGDAYKALRLPRGTRTLTDAFASVILDRAAGVVGLAVLAVIGAAGQMVGGERGPVILSAFLLGILVLLTYGALFILGGRLGREPSEAARGGILTRALLLLKAVARGTRGPRTSSRAITMGVLTGSALVGANILLALAVHISVPFGAMAAMLLLASLVAVVPLSINGIGFREATYVWGLATLGIGHDEALAFALLALGAGLSSSAAGGLVYAAAGGKASSGRPGGDERQ